MTNVVSMPLASRFGQNEQKILQGLCPDCGAPMKKWTPTEIAEAKEDLGMGPDDDFADCCSACAKKYMPPERGMLYAVRTAQGR